MTDTDKRSGYLAGMRALLDALDADPDLPLPWDGVETHMSVFAKTKTEVAAYARLMGKASKNVTDSPGGSYGFRLTGDAFGIPLMVYVHRDEVCRRVATGTETFTREVPDPDALAAVPMTTVTETIETVEWVCEPILSAVAS